METFAQSGWFEKANSWLLLCLNDIKSVLKIDIICIVVNGKDKDHNTAFQILLNALHSEY